VVVRQIEAVTVGYIKMRTAIMYSVTSIKLFRSTAVHTSNLSGALASTITTIRKRIKWG
jgi:hypothetical protein